MEPSEDEKPARLGTSKTKLNKLNIPTRKRPLNQGRIRAILSSLLVVIVLIFFNKLPSKPLPESYALCSPNGKIYTVDPSRNVTECILVHRKSILYTGSLGPFLLSCLKRSIY